VPSSLRNTTLRGFFRSWGDPVKHGQPMVNTWSTTGAVVWSVQSHTGRHTPTTARMDRCITGGTCRHVQRWKVKHAHAKVKPVKRLTPCGCAWIWASASTISCPRRTRSSSTSAAAGGRPSSNADSALACITCWRGGRGQRGQTWSNNGQTRVRKWGARHCCQLQHQRSSRGPAFE
jgi:hypothetical protein